MMCRFCKRYTEYCREDRRAMLAYGKGFRAYAHLQCYIPTLTGEKWRARDIEMAVFQAQGDGRSLNVLPPL
jgi:hypothetical protein